MPDESPLRLWMQSHQATADQVALVAGCDPREIFRAIAGVPKRLPWRIVQAVETLDGPEAAQALASAYEKWRAERAEHLRQELATSGRP